MNYSQYIPSEAQTITVGPVLIESGDYVWQIRNIVGISVGEKTFPPTGSAPVFDKKRPEMQNNSYWFMLLMVISFILSLIANNALLVIFSVLGGLIPLAIHSSKMNEWNKENTKYIRELTIWNDLLRDPPKAYSLTIETNSASFPTFHSFDKQSVTEAAQAIKQAMITPRTDQVVFNINAIKVNGDATVNNIGSKIYEQQIQEIR
ncbi:MAG: hypothetical protein RL122_616 [Pseudomonadota bacterium]|jgi:hypothetical protein|uniref:Uncharacterized protein n=1 Tax=Thiothrix fructosivorans TaxID=111770 RepID=A0A8B0SFT9_9GAMM|nr:hypothetical protein [Thiothrix fructosivorans]MBO0614450.1 hypothetical protein [Thiothrix fructosivorans]QTX09290.1 hypothetical protein J1836_011610 [Thiothrix fructosivorans]